MNENPLQGSFVIDELTDLVEEAVLQEFERISERGGVLGAMETGYQRGRIQDESMLYEQRKQTQRHPADHLALNTLRNPQTADTAVKSRHHRTRPRHRGREAVPAAARAHLSGLPPGAGHAALAALKDAAMQRREPASPS
ncbi:Fused isobutyryl-CoA mutase [Streptomyces alboniger]